MSDLRNLDRIKIWINGKEQIELSTGKCMVCNNPGFVIVTLIEWREYQRNPYRLLQDIFKFTDRDDLEQLISGLHGPCFDEMYPEEV